VEALLPGEQDVFRLAKESMFDAQLLISTGTGGSATSVYGPWFSRGGDNAEFAVEVIAMDATDLTTVFVTKNRDESGDGDAIATRVIENTAAGVQRDTVVASDAMKELVRYKFTVTGASGKWVLFRVLAPVWYDSVKA
jgi:hypothetical protein